MYKDDPREIVARFDCICQETGKTIKKGEVCIYYPKGKSVYHKESNQAREFYAWQQDILMGHNY